MAPVPTLIHRNTTTPEVTWSTGNGSPGLVTVETPGAPAQLFAEAPSGTEGAPWITVGQAYVFRLYSIVSGRRLLARLTVGHKVATQIVALPANPRITSPAVNRVLQLLSFVVLAIMALLSVAYVRDLRHDR